MAWIVYILRCKNGAFYVGHTRDLKARLETHRCGKGANFTARHVPIELVYQELQANKKDAMAREKQLKNWSRAKKKALISGDLKTLKRFARCHQQHSKPKKASPNKSR